MRARERRALASHLENLLVHLLKWRYQPEGCQTGHGWADSIREARTQLAAGLRDAYADSPQFRHSAVRRYRVARREASHQTGLPFATFPEACPWTVEQVLDQDFWPDAYPLSARATASPTRSAPSWTGSCAQNNPPPCPPSCRLGAW